MAGGQTFGFVDLALGWLDNLISILKDIAGLKIVHEERLPLLSAWIQDFADAQIIKDNWPPQAQMLANCHALLDASHLNEPVHDSLLSLFSCFLH